MEKITASEVVGELRKMGRMYEVMKRAEEMVTVIANLEQIEREVKKNISQAEINLQDLEKKYKNTIERMDKLVADAQDRLNKMNKEVEMAKISADDLIRNARHESSQIRSKALAESEVNMKAIQKLRDEEAKAKQDLQIMQTALNQLTVEMHSKRDQILKAFN